MTCMVSQHSHHYRSDQQHTRHTTSPHIRHTCQSCTLCTQSRPPGPHQLDQKSRTHTMMTPRSCTALTDTYRTQSTLCRQPSVRSDHLGSQCSHQCALPLRRSQLSTERKVSPDWNRCLQSQRHMTHIETREMRQRLQHMCPPRTRHTHCIHHSRRPGCQQHTPVDRCLCLSKAWTGLGRRRTGPDSSSSCTSMIQRQHTRRRCSHRTQSCCQSPDLRTQPRTGCSC
jgi:hypothetical protein